MSRPRKLIQFYLTNICNSHCKTCQIWKEKDKKDLWVDKVIETIKDFPDADFVFGGGEFTLYRYKEILLHWCDVNNINYTVLSNAVNVNKLENILKGYNIKNLTISCDGTKHDEIRGVDGNLRNIEYIIDNWKNKIPNIKISYTLSSFNESCIDTDMYYFRNLGFDKIYFCIAQNMKLLKADDIDITPDIQSIKYLQESYSYMLYDKDQQLLEDIVSGIHKTCDSTKDVHTIYNNGDVVRCQSYLSCDIIGNINKTSLKQLLHFLELKEVRMKFLYGDKLIEKCQYNDVCELVCQRRYDYEDRV